MDMVWHNFIFAQFNERKMIRDFSPALVCDNTRLRQMRYFVDHVAKPTCAMSCDEGLGTKIATTLSIS
jgi:hypothetical protein